MKEYFLQHWLLHYKKKKKKPGSSLDPREGSLRTLWHIQTIHGGLMLNWAVMQMWCKQHIRDNQEQWAIWWSWRVIKSYSYFRFDHCFAIMSKNKEYFSFLSTHTEISTDEIIRCWRVPIVAPQKRIWLVSMRTQVQSLALLSGLRIQYCRELWCKLQMWLGFHIAVAVVWVGSCSSDLT